MLLHATFEKSFICLHNICQNKNIIQAILFCEFLIQIVFKIFN